jgi:hypothetical protein
MLRTKDSSQSQDGESYMTMVVKSQKGIMFHDVVGLCIINFYPLLLLHLRHVAVTHTTRKKARGKLFQSNLNHDRRSKILFQTNPDSYYFFPSSSSFLSRLGSPTCLRFLRTKLPFTLPSLPFSIDQRLMLTTRLTYVRFIYAARKKAHTTFVCE